MKKMKIATVMLVFLSTAVTLFVSEVQASKFWDDFYVNFGDWNVDYRTADADSGNIVVNLGLDNTSGKLQPFICLPFMIGSKYKIIICSLASQILCIRLSVFCVF